MDKQLSLFDIPNETYYWEYPVIDEETLTILDVQKPDEEYYYSYFCSFFDQCPKVYDKLRTADEVWIKPNITSSEKYECGRTSNPHVLSALLDFFRNVKENNRIFVSDSSVIGCDTFNAAKECGILSVCDTKNIEFIDLRNVDYTSITVNHKLLYSAIEIAQPFTRDNVFKVNLGKIKSTYGSPIGFTIKNAKGVIRDELKIQFHTRGVQESICDLYECIKWDVAILEGLPMSELGQPKGNGPIIISDSALMCDYYAASTLLDLPANDINHPFHLNILAKRYEIDDSCFSSQFRQRRSKCAKKLDYCLHGIKQLEQDYGIPIHDGKPCSGCLESFAKALGKRETENLNDIKTLFVLGSGNLPHDSVPRALIGNCAIDSMIMSVFMNCNNQHVSDESLIALRNEIQNSFPTRGCPPTINDIKKTIDCLCDQYGILKSRDKYSRFEVTYPSILNSNLPEIYKKLSYLVPKECVLFSMFDTETLIACEIVCAAICHQMNWNYLRNAIMTKTIESPQWHNPNSIKTISIAEVKSMFSKYDKPERVRADERASLLQQLGYSAIRSGGNYTDIFFDKSGNIKDYCDIASFFNDCEVFSKDPESKKTQILFQSLSVYPQLSKIRDYCNPAIDYHIIRTYLRRGLVYPLTEFTHERLYSWNVKSERTIGILRGFCASVIKNLSSASKLTVNEINHIDWWIGRSVCIQNEPDCSLKNTDAQWLKNEYSKCPFYDNCDAIMVDNKLMRINEPNYSGTSY